MHRIEGSNYIVSGGNKLFSDGPPGTTVTDDWLNAVQEELAYLIEQSGGTLKTAATETRQQLYSAFLTLLAAGSSAFKTDTITQKTSDADIAVKPDGTNGLVIGDNGKVWGTALHNAGAANETGVTNQYLASGKYTPTITNGANITSSTAQLAQWVRVGNCVIVSGYATVRTSAAGALAGLTITLPIAANFTTIYQAGGHCSLWVNADMHQSGEIYAIVGNTVQVEFRSVAIEASERAFTYHFMYEVIS